MSFPHYRPPPWLLGGHAQTLWPLTIKQEPVHTRRERWDTPDGDFVDVDHVDGPPGAPLLVLFHGLEGSSRSHYAVALSLAVRTAGWRLAIPHFRGCSGELNRRPRAYHSGDSDEIDWILARLHAGNHGRPLFAVGVSLGGNALLKWAGERGADAGRRVAGIASVCAPIDLAACGHHLARGFNRLYTYHFLQSLKTSSAARLSLFPGLYDEERMRRAVNLHEFDAVVTAPLHGFESADEYWRRTSSKPWLSGIRVPALVLNARNDPFLPARYLPQTHEVGPGVRLEYPAAGGHVGFVSGAFPGQLDWLPQRLLHFFRHEIQ